MDGQSIFNLVSGALLVGVGWWCREIWDSVKTLKDDVKKIEANINSREGKYISNIIKKKYR